MSGYYPPPLQNPFPPIPLPQLTTVRPILHPLLCVGGILWDTRVPPTFAVIASTSIPNWVNLDSWRTQPATNPPSTSVCIRSPILERPIMVFPAQPHQTRRVVSIFDVLTAVHHALAAVFPRGQLPSTGQLGGENPWPADRLLPSGSFLFQPQPNVIGNPPAGWRRDRQGVFIVEAGPYGHATNGIPGPSMRTQGWMWLGLSASLTERDVWSLHLQ